MSALPSRSPKPANSAARGGGNTATELSEGIAGNIMQVAEDLGERSVSFFHAGSSALFALTSPSPSDDAHDGSAARTAASNKVTIQDRPLDEIHIGPRHRQDLGDLQPFPDSMDANSLLQPIGVTASFALVFGERLGRPAKEKMARGPQFFPETFPRPLLLKDIKVVATDPLHRIAGRARPDRCCPSESCLHSSHGTEQRGGASDAAFRSAREGPVSRTYAAMRATTLYYDKLNSLFADN